MDPATTSASLLALDWGFTVAREARPEEATGALNRPLSFMRARRAGTMQFRGACV
jgi:hypothetical protein